MILIIDNYDSFTYNLVQELGVLGAEVKVVKNDRITLDEIAALKPDALVFSPGPGNPDSAGITLAAIKRFAGQVPMLGVCLGHQAIAQAFGGRIVPAKRLMHGKTSKLRHDGKGLFLGFPQGMEAMRYHSLAVDRATLPDCFTVTAEAEDGEIMGLRHKTLPIESIQYHPESIGTPDGINQLKNFLDAVPNGRRASATVKKGGTEVLAALKKAEQKCHLTSEETQAAFDEIMSGGVENPVLIGALLTAIEMNGPTVDEILGATKAMRAAGIHLSAPESAVDIVGTGGDGFGTFNCSTTAAFIASGAGVTIAKHGNRASTSKSGAADCLAALGYNLGKSVTEIERSIAENGIGFCFANLCHPAMRFAAPVRKALPYRSIFNLLGPLTNPAGVRRMALGVYAPEVIPQYVGVLKALGVEKALVFCGEVPMTGGELRYVDELSLSGVSRLAVLSANGKVVETIVDPKRIFGAYEPISAIAGGTPEENARLTREVLEGRRRDAYRNAACLNAAAALVAGGKAKDIEAGVKLAEKSIDSGAAKAKLEALCHG